MTVTISVQTDDARVESLIWEFVAQITKLKVAFTVSRASDCLPLDGALEIKADPSLRKVNGSILKSLDDASTADHKHITCSTYTKQSKGKRLCRHPTSKLYRPGISFDSCIKDDTRSTSLVMCTIHLKKTLEHQEGFGASGVDWINFTEWISDYLSPETRLALKLNMISSAWSNAKSRGNIYVHEIPEYMDDAITFKIGRSDNPLARHQQLEKQCRPRKYIPMGMWPFDTKSDKALRGGKYYDITTTPLVSGNGVRWLECLVHHEIADLVKHVQHLSPTFPKVTFSEATHENEDKLDIIRRSQRRPKTPFREMRSAAQACEHCGVKHHEIFSLPTTQYQTKEAIFESVIKPIIQKWGRFVQQFD